MARATRTVNPLHFEDLEPHRFEDLIRQLAYEYRPWASIEATGRGGADDGIDIRAFEGVTEQEPNDDEDDLPSAPPARLWIMQCKRERRITPKQVERYVQESVRGEEVPYGFVLAAACDFSKKSYDAFRAALIGTGVQEFHLWGKAELEDMLFQPKNDHLLFAYFGISLQIRKRSKRTELRSLLALRKRVGRAIGGTTKGVRTDVLFRLADDDRYPMIADVPEFHTNPPWDILEVQQINMQNDLVVELRRHLAYWNGDTGEWDALPQPLPRVRRHQLYTEKWTYDQTAAARLTAWEQAVPEEMRAELVVLSFVALDRILGIDEDGDVGHPVPTMYLDALPGGTLLDPRDEVFVLERRFNHSSGGRIDADPEKHVPYFKDFAVEDEDNTPT